MGGKDEYPPQVQSVLKAVDDDLQNKVVSKEETLKLVRSPVFKVFCRGLVTFESVFGEERFRMLYNRFPPSLKDGLRVVFSSYLNGRRDKLS